MVERKRSTDPSGAPTVSQGQWGRTGKATSWHVAQVLLIITTTPIMVVYFFLCLDQYGGSLSQPALDWTSGKESLWDIIGKLPKLSCSAVWIAGFWLALQVLLWNLPDFLTGVIPGYKGGYQMGAVSPAGVVLPYNINGLQAWLISNSLFVAGAYYNWFSPTIVFDNFGSLLWVAIIFGNSLAVFVYIKAHTFPNNRADCKFTGSRLYDFMMGIEFNPRIGRYFDLKLFFNGRPGIVAWTVINLSFALKQRQLHGHVTDSMLVVNLLQAVYVVDFFWNENWYLHTIDIAHEHFGWMLAFGDPVWLPYMYTLQGHFLVHNPVELGAVQSLAILALGTLGYYMFRAVNHQKDRFRRTNGKCKVWGRPARFISASYTTANGEVRSSKLLTSGWWGISRHMNYTGDLLGSLAYCLCCGRSHLLPYFYIIYMVILLTHRCLRDEERCRAKYGRHWDKYTAIVKYRLVPAIF